LNELLNQAKTTQKKEKKRGKGGKSGQGELETPTSLSISHTLTGVCSLCLSLSLSRWPPVAAWRHHQPSRVAGERSRPTSPTQRQPPKHHRFSSSRHTTGLHSKPTHLNPQRTTPTCRNPVTHTGFGLPCKSGGRIRPQTRWNATKTSINRGLGFEFAGWQA